MQDADCKVQNKAFLPPPSWEAGGWAGGAVPSPGAVGVGVAGPWEVHEGRSGLSGRGSVQGRERDTVAPAAPHPCDFPFPPR